MESLARLGAPPAMLLRYSRLAPSPGHSASPVAAWLSEPPSVSLAPSCDPASPIQAWACGSCLIPSTGSATCPLSTFARSSVRPGIPGFEEKESSYNNPVTGCAVCVRPGPQTRGQVFRVSALVSSSVK